MANLEKHKKNPILEWLEAEESTLPTHSRSTHVLGSYIKIPKPAPKKFRQSAPSSVAPKPDAALARDPAPPPKLTGKTSQLASFEHQRRLDRLPNLRAPYQYKGR